MVLSRDARDRLFVAANLPLAAGLGWLLFVALSAVLPAAADRTQALGWLLLVPALVVLGLALAVAQARFLSSAIDPISGRDTRFVDVSNRVLRNTVEQTTIFVLAGGALIAIAPEAELATMPAIAALFAVARLMFWAGYLAHHILRAPGMGITLLLNGVLAIRATMALAG